MPGPTPTRAAEVGGAWHLVIHRAPREPSTERVAAWRRLKRLGALYIGPSTCLLPAALEPGAELEELSARLGAAGGRLLRLEVAAFTEAAERVVRECYNAERDAEYAELLERADALLAELEREGGRGKFTFAEVEENEADLAKLRRWLEGVRRRDLFHASGLEPVERRIAGAASELARFAERAAERESGGP